MEKEKGASTKSSFYLRMVNGYKTKMLDMKGYISTMERCISIKVKSKCAAHKKYSS